MVGYQLQFARLSNIIRSQRRYIPFHDSLYSLILFLLNFLQCVHCKFAIFSAPAIWFLFFPLCDPNFQGKFPPLINILVIHTNTFYESDKWVDFTLYVWKYFQFNCNSKFLIAGSFLNFRTYEAFKFWGQILRERCLAWLWRGFNLTRRLDFHIIVKFSVSLSWRRLRSFRVHFQDLHLFN